MILFWFGKSLSFHVVKWKWLLAKRGNRPPADGSSADLRKILRKRVYSSPVIDMAIQMRLLRSSQWPRLCFFVCVSLDCSAKLSSWRRKSRAIANGRSNLIRNSISLRKTFMIISGNDPVCGFLFVFVWVFTCEYAHVIDSEAWQSH